MSRYDEQACLRRAENILSDWDGGRVIREHQENSLASTSADEARIARGFAVIARLRRQDEVRRANLYRRLANGEDIADADDDHRDPLSGAPMPRVFIKLDAPSESNTEESKP